MSERWKPMKGETYWIVGRDATIHKFKWSSAGYDSDHYDIGNCFKTEKAAQAAAEKVKALLLSLHEPSSQLPELTAEVFNRPDCPEWARYAAVDGDGRARFHAEEPFVPSGYWWCSEGNDGFIGGEFDASDWKNSLIKRPAKLPDWCKVGEWVWLDGNYHKVIEVGEDWIRTEWNNNTGIGGVNILRQFSQARLRPYNADEMRGLVGKVVTTSSGRHCTLVTACKQEYSVIEPQVMLNKWLYATDLLHGGNTIDGKPCGVFEHLENGEWVE